MQKLFKGGNYMRKYSMQGNSSVKYQNLRVNIEKCQCLATPKPLQLFWAVWPNGHQYYWMEIPTKGTHSSSVSYYLFKYADGGSKTIIIFIPRKCIEMIFLEIVNNWLSMRQNSSGGLTLDPFQLSGRQHSRIAYSSLLPFLATTKHSKSQHQMNADLTL